MKHYIKKYGILTAALAATLALTAPACSTEETAPAPQLDGLSMGTVTDKAGNTYKTFTLGNQTWLAENYRYALEKGSLDGCLTYGESFSASDLEVLTGTDRTKYQRFIANHNGQRFMLFLREQVVASGAEGKIKNAAGNDYSNTVLNQLKNYSIPQMIALSPSYFAPMQEELLRIWNLALDNYFKTDPQYLAQYGYLYSYEGAQKAVKEGAPEGFHIPTDAEWMVLERRLGLTAAELEGLEQWRGTEVGAGDLLKPGGFGFDALYGGAAIYALSTAYNTNYVNKGEGAYFWTNDRVVVSDSLSNGIVRHVSLYERGIRRNTTRLITSPTKASPSYSLRLVKTLN